MNKNINAQWHLKHRMPKNPTRKDRIVWHTQHVIHCQCRPIPQNLQEEIAKRQQD